MMTNADKGNDISFVFSVDKPVPEAWSAWTTNEGLRSFFSPNSRIDLRPEGDIEILFDMDAPEGFRGSEGMKVMAVEPESMLSFIWNAPPSIPEIRDQRTFVTIRMFPLGERATYLDFRNVGYGNGDEWRKTRRYFMKAWGSVVLPRFRFAMAHGPVDWDHEPDISPYSLMGECG